MSESTSNTPEHDDQSKLHTLATELVAAGNENLFVIDIPTALWLAEVTTEDGWLEAIVEAGGDPEGAGKMGVDLGDGTILAAGSGVAWPTELVERKFAEDGHQVIRFSLAPAPVPTEKVDRTRADLATRSIVSHRNDDEGSSFTITGYDAVGNELWVETHPGPIVALGLSSLSLGGWVAEPVEVEGEAHGTTVRLTAPEGITGQSFAA